MKLPLLLSALAALLVWGSFTLDGLGAVTPIVAARSHARPAAIATTPAPLSVRDATGVDASAPPLFRPAVTPAALTAPRPGESFTLVGLVGAGEARMALLRDSADQQVFSVRTGESVRDWTVAEENQRCVVLRKARQRQNICLT